MIWILQMTSPCLNPQSHKHRLSSPKQQSTTVYSMTNPVLQIHLVRHRHRQLKFLVTTSECQRKSLLYICSVRPNHWQKETWSTTRPGRPGRPDCRTCWWLSYMAKPCDRLLRSRWMMMIIILDTLLSIVQKITFYAILLGQVQMIFGEQWSGCA